MNKERGISILSTLIIILALIPTSAGLFWDDGGQVYEFQNLYGDTVKMFGNGLYAGESYFKAPINKGTDAAVLFVFVPLFAVALYLMRRPGLWVRLLHAGLSSCILYYSVLQGMEVSFNPLFLVYVGLFSASLFNFILSLSSIPGDRVEGAIGERGPRKAAAVFVILAGFSVFVWFIDIIAALKTGKLPAHYGAGITLPTFMLDLGIVAPTAFATGWLLLKRRPMGYTLAAVLLTLNAFVGVVVISQTLFQYSYGVILTPQEFIPFVGVFIVMSLVAVYLDLVILRLVKTSV